MRLGGCTITRRGVQGWIADDREPEGELYIACRIEAHCLPVRTAQILPPSPASAAIPYISMQTACTRVYVRVLRDGRRRMSANVGEYGEVLRTVGKWRVGISDKAFHDRHSFDTSAGARARDDKSRARDFHDNQQRA